MANEVRKYDLSLLEIANMANMCRGSRLVAGSLARQDVLKKLRKIQDDLTDSEKSAIDIRKIFKSVSLNREEIGGMKLTFIELWSAENTTGDLREAIERAATSLDIWRTHVYKNLPKEPSVAIDSFDSDDDIMKGDSGEGKVEDVPAGIVDPPPGETVEHA